MSVYVNENAEKDIINSGIFLPRVTAVIPRSDYTLDVTFATGEQKIYDAKRFLANDPKDPLNDLRLFMKAHVEGWTVVWNDEIDIAPEELYENGSGST